MGWSGGGRSVQVGLARADRWIWGMVSPLWWLRCVYLQGIHVVSLSVQNIREHLHAHICDRRVPKSELMELFPSFVFPADMSEGDTLWQHGSVRDRETEEELTDRAGRGLEECLDLSEDATCE